jgi:hypothetical protein
MNESHGKVDRFAAYATIAALPVAIIGVYLTYLQINGNDPVPKNANFAASKPREVTTLEEGRDRPASTHPIDLALLTREALVGCYRYDYNDDPNDKSVGGGYERTSKRLNVECIDLNKDGKCEYFLGAVYDGRDRRGKQNQLVDMPKSLYRGIWNINDKALTILLDSMTPFGKLEFEKLDKPKYVMNNNNIKHFDKVLKVIVFEDGRILKPRESHLGDQINSLEPL